jgi:hypothetical protein
MNTTNVKLAITEKIGESAAYAVNAASNASLYVDHGTAAYKYLTSEEARKIEQDAIKKRSAERLDALRMKHLGAAA